MLLSLGMLMLSATQIYTIFTVQLFAFLNLLPVEADIAAVSTTSKCLSVCLSVLLFEAVSLPLHNTTFKTLQGFISAAYCRQAG